MTTLSAGYSDTLPGASRDVRVRIARNRFQSRRFRNENDVTALGTEINDDSENINEEYLEPAFRKDISYFIRTRFKYRILGYRLDVANKLLAGLATIGAFLQAAFDEYMFISIVSGVLGIIAIVCRQLAIYFLGRSREHTEQLATTINAFKSNLNLPDVISDEDLKLEYRRRQLENSRYSYDHEGVDEEECEDEDIVQEPRFSNIQPQSNRFSNTHDNRILSNNSVKPQINNKSEILSSIKPQINKSEIQVPLDNRLSSAKPQIISKSEVLHNNNIQSPAIILPSPRIKENSLIEPIKIISN